MLKYQIRVEANGQIDTEETTSITGACDAAREAVELHADHGSPVVAEVYRIDGRDESLVYHVSHEEER